MIPSTTPNLAKSQSAARPALRGLLLDMDGTLFDSETIHLEAWHTVLEAVGAFYDDVWFMQWIGRPDRQLPTAVLADHALGIEPEELLRRKHAAYRALIPGRLVPYPDVVERIRGWLAAGVPIAVCSSSRRLDVDLSLEASGLAGLLPIRVGLEDAAAPKPDPSPYRLAASLLGLEPASCLAIEDSPSGIASALAAGCLTYAVATSHSMEMLTELLAELGAGPARVFADTPAALAAADEALEALKKLDMPRPVR